MMNKIIETMFFKAGSGKMPVREWFYTLSKEDRKRIGEELKTVEYGWPLGMPIVRKLEPGLWEVRVHLKGRIARVVFTVIDDYMVLLHGFIKKSQKAPEEIKIALKRLKTLEGSSL